VVAVQVANPQAKYELKGGNLPCALRKRRRGSRGRRKGGIRLRRFLPDTKARGQQPRRRVNAPPTLPQKQGLVIDESSYAGKARARRDLYIDSRLAVIRNIYEKGKRILVKAGLDENSEPRALGKFAEERSVLWIKHSMGFVRCMMEKRPPLAVTLRINDFLLPLNYAIPVRETPLYILSEAARLAKDHRKKTLGRKRMGPDKPIIPKGTKCVCERPSGSQVCRICGRSVGNYVIPARKVGRGGGFIR